MSSRFQATSWFVPEASAVMLFVTPREASPWSVKPEEFLRLLRKSWKVADAQVGADSDDPNAVHFRLDAPHGVLEGALARSARTLVLEYGDLRDCAAMALWFRSLVPSDERLVFCDEAGNGYTELTSRTTQDELLKAYGYQPERP